VYESNFAIGLDGVWFSSSSPDSFFPNSRIPDVLGSNASLKQNWRRLFHALNSGSQSDPAIVTTREGRNASPAMNAVLSGTTTKDSCVSQQARASMHANSEFVLNEINESHLQSEKHDEQIIWT
jgi:hypothetical protein